jgi:hypothetical protein
MKYIFCIILIYLYLCRNEVSSDDCESWSIRHLFSTNDLVYFNITSYIIELDLIDDLKMAFCINISKSENVGYIVIVSKKLILFDNDLDFDPLFDSFSTGIRQRGENFIFEVRSFNGFNFKIFSESFKMNFSEFPIHFKNVRLEFYLNETLIDKSMCAKENFIKNHPQPFGSFKSAFFEEDISYSQTVCPYVFKYTSLLEFGLYEISNSLIYKNQFGFIDISNDNNESFRVENLKIFYLKMYSECFSTQIMNTFVFEHVEQLYLSGVIASIQNETFQHFKFFKIVSLNLENIREFFHLGIEWVAYLNKGTMSKKKIVLVEFVEESSFFKSVYKYPENDFCLFEKFPHANRVFPFLMPYETVECSCTIIWLLKNSSIFTYEYLFNNRYLFENFTNLNNTFHCVNEKKKFMEMVEACKFQSRIEKCFNFSYTKGLF